MADERRESIVALNGRERPFGLFGFRPWRGRAMPLGRIEFHSMHRLVAAFHDQPPGFTRALRAWYRRNGRSLPWRDSADPYRVWISEIMLQQTTVAAVVPYFERFVARFPDLEALAQADEHDVLRLWEGLGYYSRARNLHRAARVIAREHRGRFPDRPEALEALPGIGRYTAGAIASFAFGQPAAIVEANTMRLYCRLVGYDGQPRSSAGQKLLWEFAESIVPRRSPGAFNQALMDLGATVCTPDAPDCRRCPVKGWCQAARSGRQSEIPSLPPRPRVSEVVEVAVAVERDGRYLVLKRPEGERWAGLWDFVRVAIPGDGAAETRPASGREEKRLAERALIALGLAVDMGPLVVTIRHTVTRFRITLRCYRAGWQQGDVTKVALPFRWVRPDELGELPLSTTGRQIAQLLAEQAAPRSESLSARRRSL